MKVSLDSSIDPHDKIQKIKLVQSQSQTQDGGYGGKSRQKPLENEDELEMRAYNKEAREQLGGSMCLQDLADKKIKNYVVKGIVFKSLTLKALKAIDDAKNNQFSQMSINSPNFDPQKYIEKAKKICCKQSDIKVEVEFDASSKNQSQNKAIFRKKYGCEITLPAFYIQDARVFPANQSFVLKVVKYVVPSENLVVQNYYPDKPDPINSCMHRIYSDDIYQKENVVLELMQTQQKDSIITTIQRVPILNAYLVNIEFSPNGKFFAIFRIKLNILQIYKIDNNDMPGLMTKVKNQDCFKEFKNNKLLKKAYRIYFDRNSQFLATYGDESINIISMKENDHFIDSSIIDQDRFQQIVGIQLVSSHDKTYRCDVACQMKNSKNVMIYQLNEDIKQDRFMSYMSGVTDLMQVKISEDFKKVVMVNKSENYEFFEDGQGYTQRSIPHLLKKTVYLVMQQGSEFYFVACADFDDDLDIESLSNPDLSVRIARKIEPGALKIYDMTQINLDETGVGNRMVVLSSVDEDFNYDIINPQAILCDHIRDPNLKKQQTVASSIQPDIESDTFRKNNLSYNPLKGRNIMWPYVAFSGMLNTIWLYNAFDQQNLNRIIPPEQEGNFQFSKYKISSDMKLYFIMISQELQKYQFWFIDLNNPKGFKEFREQRFKMEKLFEYTFMDTECTPLLDFVVRSESKKDLLKESIRTNINRNQKIRQSYESSPCHDGQAKVASSFDKGADNLKLIVFFHHQGFLFSWSKGQNQLAFASKISSKKLEIINNHEFVFQSTDDSDKKNFNLSKVNCMFSTYFIDNLYTEKSVEKESILSYAFDSHAQMLIIIYKNPQLRALGKRRFKFYDLKAQKTLLSLPVGNKNILGRFKMGMFTLIDGHVYYANDVIKIRYDLLRQEQTIDLKEEQVFDTYNGLLDLKLGEFVQENNPIICHNNSRMAYFTRNQAMLESKRLMILPYMHERKIRINKMKNDCSYFYTMLEESAFEVDIDLKKKLHTHQGSIKTIISMDLSRCRYSVFSESALLLNKVNFYHQVQQYGSPVQVSENGMNFLFQDQNDLFKVSILRLTSSGLEFVKTIDIQKEIDQYVSDIQEKALSHEDQYLANQLARDLFGEYQTYFVQTNAILNFAINDNQDVVVMISSKLEQELYNQMIKTFNAEDLHIMRQLFRIEHEQKVISQQSKNTKMKNMKTKLVLDSKQEKLMAMISMETKSLLSNMAPELQNNIRTSIQELGGSIIYIQKGCHKTQESPSESQENDSSSIEYQALFFTNNSPEFIAGQEIGQFTCNTDYIIFWSYFEVFYMELNQTSNHVKMSVKKLTFLVDPEEKQTYVRNVTAGSNSNQITIDVRQSKSQLCILLWDMKEDKEIQSFDQPNNCTVFYDAYGDPYVTNRKSVLFCFQNVEMQSYGIEDVHSESDSSIFFPYSKGHRFDHDNHNWILFNEFISLSFSFMTLVIRDKTQIENNYQDANYMFDKEQYNFIINKKTCFTCDNFVANDFEKLSFVLRNMKKVDPVLLQQLHYFYTVDAAGDSKMFAILVQQSAKYGSSMRKKDDNRSKLIKSMTQSKRSLNKSIDSVITEDQSQNSSQEIKITPLHLAFNEGNNRSINIILSYMAQIDNNCSSTFKDILPKLVEYDSFVMYMKELPFQTIQMMNKQTLKMNEKFNDEIVAIQRNTSSYCDDFYYKYQMGENRDNEKYKNYPVSIWALKVDWILNDSEGKYFLMKILNSENNDLYDCQPIKLIIEFLYIHSRQVVLKYRLPVYVVQLVIYFIAILIHESQNDQISLLEGQTTDILSQVLEEESITGETSQWYERLNLKDFHRANMNQAGFFAGKQNIRIFVALLNLICVTYSIVMVYKQGRASFQTFFKSIWAYFDILYIVINGLISFSQLFGSLLDSKDLRIVESILSVVIMLKLVYYTQLVDEIAPLVNIIIKIFVDIGYFIVIFILCMFSFAISFYLIGQNQFDEVSYDTQKNKIGELLESYMTGKVEHEEVQEIKEQMELPGYYTFLGSMQHVYLLALGDFDIDAYQIGDGSQTGLLWFFFLISSFFMLIHLLNMLIAIMGETFSENNEIKKKQQIKSHLRFVLDNDWIVDMENKNQITYLITAFLSLEENDESQLLQNINSCLHNMMRQQQKDKDKMLQKLNSVKAMVENMHK